MAQCRKRRYKTKTDAMIALSRTQLREATSRKHTRSTDREETRYYHCPHCRGWHLTSTPERQVSHDRHS